MRREVELVVRFVEVHDIGFHIDENRRCEEPVNCGELDGST